MGYLRNKHLLMIVVLLLQISLLRGDSGEVEEHILPNGLRLLLREVHTSPIVSVWSWYDVGSRNERPGITGIAHFLEHMNFKGTEGFSRDEMKGLIDALGGSWNGYTWMDQTTYFETLPSSGLELALKLEAERMQKSILDPEELEKERTVVISELQGGESDPRNVLDIEVTAAAFKAHPYGWPAIGWLSDLDMTTQSDMLDFYNTYYIPNNATLVVVGDFDARYVREKVWELFKDIPVSPSPPGLRTIEPEQQGERRVVVRKKGPAAYVQISYHTPPVSDEDFLPLLVLDAVLAGGESINMWNLDWYEDASRSSRLYKSLIETGLASSAGALLVPTRYPWLFSIYATAMDGVEPESLESSLLEGIENLRTHSVDKEELQRAKNQLLARYIYDNDSVTEQAHQLGFFATVYHYRYAFDFPGLLEKVTAEEVGAAARKYLVPDNRTVGWFLPRADENADENVGSNGSGSREAGPYRGISTFNEEEVHPSDHEELMKFDAPTFSHIAPAREVLENGLTVLALQNRISPSAHLRVTIRAGSVVDPLGKSGLASLTSRFLLEGSGELSGEEISTMLDFGGTEISIDTEKEFVTIDVDLLTREYQNVIELVGSIVMAPLFPADAVERLKQEMMAEIDEEEQNEHAVSNQTLMEMIYPAGHPYRVRVNGLREDVAELSAEDARTFFQGRYCPENVSVVVTGDIDTKHAIEEIRKVFGGWESSGVSFDHSPPVVERQEKSATRIVSMPEKTQASISMGHIGITRSNPDYNRLQVMNNILGQFGMGGRLGAMVREEKGYAYFVFSSFEGGLGQSPFFVMAGVSPGVAEETVDLIVAEIEKMADEGPSEKEVERSKKNILGSLALSLEENQGLAEILSEIEFYDLGLSFLEEYSRGISSVTKEDVRRVSREYLAPGVCSIAVAGPVDEDWKVLGRVEEGGE